MTTAPNLNDPSGVTELPASEARKQISALLDAVEEGQFIYLTRNGKRVAALMPADVAENYEKIEDDYWGRRAADALHKLETGEEEAVSWEAALVKLESNDR